MAASHDVEIFNASADEPGGTDLIVIITGAQASGQASAPSANQSSNSIDVDLIGTQAIAGSTSPSAQTSGAIGNPDFPRMYLNRFAERYYTEDNADGEAERAAIAEFDVVTLGMRVGGAWDRGDAGYLSRLEVIEDLRARNPNITIFDYTVLMETGLDGERGTYLQSQVGPGGTDWFMWKEGLTERATSFQSGSGTSYWVNITPEVTPDINGDRAPQYTAKYFDDNMLSPVLDNGVPTGVQGYNIFVDNVFLKSRLFNTDYDADGIRDRGREFWDETATYNTPLVGQPEEGLAMMAAWRGGQKAYVDELKTLRPGTIVMGNTAEWGDEQEWGTDPRPWMPPDYNLTYAGGWAEHCFASDNNPFGGIGSEGQVNNFGKWTMGYMHYRQTLDFLESPNFGVAGSHLAMYQDGFFPLDPTARSQESNDRIWPRYPDTITGGFNLVRWTIASVLMADGYVYITGDVDGSGGEYGGSPWFDEYGGGPGEGTTGLSKGWLGQPIDPVQDAPWYGEVWKREFDNGLIILNTSDVNTADVVVTDELPNSTELFSGDWRKFVGVQDTVHNNGETLEVLFPSVPRIYTIQPSDALILVRV